MKKFLVSVNDQMCQMYFKNQEEAKNFTFLGGVNLTIKIIKELT